MKCLTLSEKNRPSIKAEVDVQQEASIRLKAESTGGVNLIQKVKLHWGNDYSRVLAQLPVDVPVRRSPGGYGPIEAEVYGASWPSLGAAHRGGRSVNIPPNVVCSNRRTLLETEEDTGRLRIDGIRELNHPNALALQRKVKAVLTDAVKTIEVDLSQTVLMDSQGLGALIALRNMMGRRRGAVRVVNPSRLAEQVLELTRLHRVFDIVKHEEGLAG